MKVVEIFKSIEGEGIRTGIPVTFIRLWGCNLRCNFCDTPYSHSEESELVQTMSVDEIIDAVRELGLGRVTITGGEPMIHPDIEELIDRLVISGHEVNIETNGTVPVPIRYRYAPIIFTMDYKCPGSGMEDKMDINTINTLRHYDVLKFVVGSMEDLETMSDVLSKIESNPQVFVSPVFGRITPKEITEYVLKYNLENVRVQVQLHKIIWSPEQRGV